MHACRSTLEDPTLTYEVVTARKRYAVRCFHKTCDSLMQRYDAIQRRLGRSASPYFVDFEFQPEGIRTESGTYPIVRMDWAEGLTLGAYVADHYEDAVTLQQLRASLRVMARQLAALGIAHGDIQPGNIVVRDATDVKLVDYDGMYLPEIASLGSVDLGQRNFRHPGRRTRHYDLRLDSFPFAVIDLSIGALAYRPELWELARCDESAFVLRAEDFGDPWTSLAFGWLRDVPGLDVKAQHLALICQSPYEDIPGIEDFLAGRNIPAPRIQVPGSAFRAQRQLYLPALPVVDAANVAQCCAHVGDQVELIGQIRQSRTAELSLTEGGIVRVEFGSFPDDMAALQVHAADARDADAALDHLRPDEWVSAIGLVEPPRSERIDGRICKMVSIQVTHRSQLTRLPESEALHRLISSARSVHSVDIAKGRVGTDPALADAGSEAPTIAMAPDGGAADWPERADTSALAGDRGFDSPARELPPAAFPTAPKRRQAPPAPAVARTASTMLARSNETLSRLHEWSSDTLTWLKSSAKASFFRLRLMTAATMSRLQAVCSATWLHVRPAGVRLVESLRLSATQVLGRLQSPSTPAASTTSPVGTSKSPAANARLRWPPWAKWAAAGFTAIVLVVMGWRDREPRSAENPAPPVTTAPPAIALADNGAEPPPRTGAGPSIRKDDLPGLLLRTRSLSPRDLPVATSGGRLMIATSSDHAVLQLGDREIEESRARSIWLAQQAYYGDREIITGWADCAQPQPRCPGWVPFWLTVRGEHAPVSYRRLSAPVGATGSGTVTTLPTGIHVDLGVWDGVRRSGMLTSLGDAYVAGVNEPSRRLDRGECREVLRALEACAAIRGCQSLDGISHALPAAHVANVRRLFHETTGLDSSGFRSVCMRSCELGLTPTSEFVQRRVCGGAQPGQWQKDVFAD